MNTFIIPKELKEKLDENRAYAALVDRTISDFGIWLGRNKTILFTEYTDHSLNHIENVLNMANDLIREQCRELITPADVATLILSVLLHDSAMHIDIDGFLNLVQSDNQQVISGFGDKSWKVMWLDFLAESRRFSGRKLMALFGDTDPVRHPPMNPKEMNLKDLLLCGEFLRRHHHRLAHEIAVFGVPGYSENNLKFEKNDDTEHIVDLAGVIARSHGLSIRDCFDYLNSEYSYVKLVRGVHPVYIMALLRIADILQIQPDRAPQQIQKVSKFNSPVSVAEWEMHQAIKDVVFNDPPETILVMAEPKNVRTYLKIRNLLDQIQNELDNSWTLIGEVYSSDNKFREFGLTIRRIRSNIDDLEQFSKRVQYLPLHASFEVADTDLLKLLIAPLYGDDPAIGIRELLQNAIDAVRELKEYQKQRPELQNIELADHEGDILISIDQDQAEKWWITVSDKGIGMTPVTLREYFLKAGASLRRSEIWKQTFENEDGKSRVLRSGRFGIGALATFLLGDNIYVSSRHVTDRSGEGIQFSTQLDTEAIEFQRIKRPIGTTIRIQISNEIKEKLEKSEKDWNWYFFDEPIVKRKLSGNNLSVNENLPNVNGDSSYEWKKLQHKDFEGIYWSFLGQKSLFVNGIIVKSSREYIFFGQGLPAFLHPKLSVFDFDAKLPLNLQRTELTTEEYPFEYELQKDILKDFIAFLLVNGPQSPITNTISPIWYFQYNYLGLERKHSYRFLPEKSYWFSTTSGFGMTLPWILNRLNFKAALIVPFGVNINERTRKISAEETYNKLPSIDSNLEQVLIGYGYDYSKYLHNKINTINDLLLNLVGTSIMYLNNKGSTYDPEEQFLFSPGIRILISRDVFNLLLDAEKFSMHLGYKPFWQEMNIDIKGIEEWSNDKWLLWRIGDCKPNNFDFQKFAESNSTNTDAWSCILAEKYFSDETIHAKKLRLRSYMKSYYSSLEDYKLDESYLERQVESYNYLFQEKSFENIWMELLGSLIIPYDMNERREKLSYAYKELKDYIEAHEIMKEKGSPGKDE